MNISIFVISVTLALLIILIVDKSLHMINQFYFNKGIQDCINGVYRQSWNEFYNEGYSFQYELDQMADNHTNIGF